MQTVFVGFFIFLVFAFVFTRFVHVGSFGSKLTRKNFFQKYVKPSRGKYFSRFTRIFLRAHKPFSYAPEKFREIFPLGDFANRLVSDFSAKSHAILRERNSRDVFRREFCSGIFLDSGSCASALAPSCGNSGAKSTALRRFFSLR